MAGMSATRSWERMPAGRLGRGRVPWKVSPGWFVNSGRDPSVSSCVARGPPAADWGAQVINRARLACSRPCDETGAGGGEWSLRPTEGRDPGRGAR